LEQRPCQPVRRSSWLKGAFAGLAVNVANPLHGLDDSVARVSQVFASAHFAGFFEASVITGFAGSQD
jgi:hypothetical protein